MLYRKYRVAQNNNEANVEILQRAKTELQTVVVDMELNPIHPRRPSPSPPSRPRSRPSTREASHSSASASASASATATGRTARTNRPAKKRAPNPPTITLPQDDYNPGNKTTTSIELSPKYIIYIYLDLFIF